MVTKKIVLGDIEEAVNLFDIAFVHLNQRDVIRHRLVRDIIQAYEQWERAKL